MLSPPSQSTLRDAHDVAGSNERTAAAMVAADGSVPLRIAAPTPAVWQQLVSLLTGCQSFSPRIVIAGATAAAAS